MGKKASNPAPDFPKPPAPPSPPRIETIGSAAIDWSREELDDTGLVQSLRESLYSGFVDGAYWASAQIEAGRIKVKVKGGGA